MSDFDNEDDIFKKMQGEENEVKPIDLSNMSFPIKPMKSSAPPLESSDLLKSGEVYKQEVPPDIAAKMAHTEFKLVQKGESVDLLRKDPTLKRLRIGAGWEQRLLEGDRIDIDLSAFLLNIKDETRIDEDFVFYNSESGAEGGIKHSGDSRTGAGEGDDEAITIDLNGIPFDIIKIVFVLSIYDEENKDHNFSQVRDLFLRVINEDDQNEICRYVFEGDNEPKDGNAIYVAMLVREGPKWFFEVQAEVINGGLAEIATKYGIIVREVQSTGN